MDFHGLRVHVIGIGGIGVSGLARYLRAQGAKVSGSDIAATSLIEGLRQEGLEINIPHTPEIIASKDLIIHSAIIKEDNVEMLEARRLNKPLLSRKEALKILLANKKVLSICAAHGKSSTSAILSALLPDSGAIIGALSKEFDSNVRVSPANLLVFEADESDKSFLNSNPYSSIVLNIEAEHLESYEQDFGLLKEAYYEFMFKAKEVVANLGCPVVAKLAERLEGESSYSELKAPKWECRADSIDGATKRLVKLDPRDIRNLSYELRGDLPYTSFELGGLGRFSVQGLGEHTAVNASLALLSALPFLPLEKLRENLLNFKGLKKRFDLLQPLSNEAPCIIDDYAHHPTEIKATLKAARIYAGLLEKQKGLDKPLKITALFQPHKYSRLRDNLEDFKACFSDCDELVILPVWAAGEAPIDFDFASLFARYKPRLATRLRRRGNQLAIEDSRGREVILESSLLVGLGAGDITYQLRGEK